MQPPNEAPMLDWQKRYAAKVKTAEDALAGVQSGERIFIGSGAAEPQVLVNALVKRASAVWGTEIVHIMTLGVGKSVV